MNPLSPNLMTTKERLAEVSTLLARGLRRSRYKRLTDSACCHAQKRGALDYAEAVTRSDRQVTDEVMERLREHFNDDAIVEPTGLIAFQNMSSKFNSALAVPAQGFCSVEKR